MILVVLICTLIGVLLGFPFYGFVAGVLLVVLGVWANTGTHV